jgi:DNA-binding transcriptional MerR regulator/methylmalonyl-CoA mutase cobalamin-binding subunit
MTDPANRQPRYPLRAVIRRTGLTADVIRAWERRYGAVSPSRSEGGQRLYSEHDVIRLSLLRKATAEGHSIGEIARLDDAALASLTSLPTGLATAPRDIDAAIHSAVVTDAIAAIEALDQVALENVLKRAVLTLGATRFIDLIAGEVLQQVGDRWHAGTLAPFHEHLATDTVRRVLAWVADAYDTDGRAPVIVVATPAGEFHELGAMLVAAAAAEEAWRVVYLGANLPAGDIVAASKKVNADVVALSLVYANGEAGAREISETARALPHGVELLVGGAAASRMGGGRLGPGVRLLDDIGSLREALRTRRELKADSTGGSR